MSQKKKRITKNRQLASVHHEKSIQFTNDNIKKNIIQTTVWFFGKHKGIPKNIYIKKIIIKKNIVSHHSQNTMTSRPKIK